MDREALTSGVRFTNTDEVKRAYRSLFDDKQIIFTISYQHYFKFYTSLICDQNYFESQTKNNHSSDRNTLTNEQFY